MYSDKFKKHHDPRITKPVSMNGQTFQVIKTWEEYTNDEKARCISHANGCGYDVALWMLELEAEIAKVAERLPIQPAL